MQTPDSLKYMQMLIFGFSVKGPDRRADKSVDPFPSKRAEAHTENITNDPPQLRKVCPQHATRDSQH